MQARKRAAEGALISRLDIACLLARSSSGKGIDEGVLARRQDRSNMEPMNEGFSVGKDMPPMIFGWRDRFDR